MGSGFRVCVRCDCLISSLCRWLDENAAAPQSPRGDAAPVPLLAVGSHDEEEVSTLAEQMKETFDLHVRREVSGLSSEVSGLRQSLTEAAMEKMRLERELESERHLRNMYEGQLAEYAQHAPAATDIATTMRRVPGPPLTSLLAAPRSPLTQAGRQ